MTRRALVTGGSGFVGQWLTSRLLAEGWEVYGTVYDSGATNPDAPLLERSERDAIHWMRADLRVPEEIASVLERSRPDAVFHLAGVSFIPDATLRPGLAYEVNVMGAAHLLAALVAEKRAGTLDPVVLMVGSGEQYGAHPLEAMPLGEDTPQRPLTVYAATKAAQEVAALQVFRTERLRVVCTRSFNHSGVGHAPHFLLPALARRAVALRGQADPELKLGNLTPVRDFLHVEDVVRAYILLAERGVPGEAYNVCSGVGRSVQQLAEMVLRAAGVDAALTSEVDLVRPVDNPVLIGDPARLRAATGWRPERNCEEMIEDLIRAATD
jgi:GDP-4-dehydro-6-deoxy-D-mannose reductase